jgi:hypothetical protein
MPKERQQQMMSTEDPVDSTLAGLDMSEFIIIPTLSDLHDWERYAEARQHSRQSHFGVSSLEATIHRGLDLALSLGGTHALAEEIGIAAEVLGWRQRDRIDPVLDRELAGGWEPRDPISEGFDEVIERGGGQRSIDPAVPLSQIRVVILRTQHDLQRHCTTHEAREMLGGPSAGKYTGGRLWLTENRQAPTRQSAYRTPARTRCRRRVRDLLSVRL